MAQAVDSDGYQGNTFNRHGYRRRVRPAFQPTVQGMEEANGKI